ncbi:uncharacterized protein M6B38_403890 [Iris pallida]|uniref:Uncharacterized protein n=1 Tax=Iris pallida TaxID=29817 RepID=A0AAX6EW32_IRIPA|nr:uncharacterized protein M6B38_167690 [Iris pallida]KAJ6819111.1 uncharacterized protein M6B38_403890 [Iris pallida]
MEGRSGEWFYKGGAEKRGFSNTWPSQHEEMEEYVALWARLRAPQGAGA